MVVTSPIGEKAPLALAAMTTAAAIIGSAAGVVASGMVKELNFGKYFKIAFVPALFGFAAGILVWLVQYTIF